MYVREKVNYSTVRKHEYIEYSYGFTHAFIIEREYHTILLLLRTVSKRVYDTVRLHYRIPYFMHLLNKNHNTCFIPFRRWNDTEIMHTVLHIIHSSQADRHSQTAQLDDCLSLFTPSSPRHPCLATPRLPPFPPPIRPPRWYWCHQQSSR